MNAQRDEYLNQPRLNPTSGEIPLPNGCTLYWKTDESVNCREYWSDEVGGGVLVWSTALVDGSSLLAAVTQEMALQKAERVRDEDSG